MPSYRELKASMGLAEPQAARTSYQSLKASLGLGMAPNPQPVPNAPGSTLTQSIAPVDTPTATNDIFVGRGTMAPGISAQPRGPKMTIPSVRDG